MGWLDKGFKNIVKGAKDVATSPAGIMMLSAATPWLAQGMSGSGMLGALGGLGGGKMGSLLASPWVKNALTNAAIQGGIATLTGSKHPWKSMGYSALASMPFTALQSAKAAKDFNTARGLTKSGEKLNWWDLALGDETFALGDETLYAPLKEGDKAFDLVEEVIDLPTQDMDMSYFLNPGQAEMASKNPGTLGLTSLAGDLDLLSTIAPQVAGMYGGRMTDEEVWLESQDKQIRLWAFQFGIPYEEAKEIWRDGYRNPYYQTKTPVDYGDIQIKNRGGYLDDYTAGGEAVGPGTGTSDSIRPVALSNGEFVFTEEATNNFPGGADGLYSLMNSLDPDSERPEEART